MHVSIRLIVIVLHENVARNQIGEVEAESHELGGKGYLIAN